MCGLVFALATRPVHEFINVAHARQHYRGPDGEGLLFKESGGVYMGMAHERLSIVGLSESGQQPMISASGRYRILFNGEVYNYRELASQFGLKHLRSGTDTEVILELVERLGIEEALKNFNGMWALIIQDVKANRFFVSRDRFGKKPLYMYRDAKGLYMASEMHSLLGLPGVDVKPDVVTASRFLAQSLQNVDNRSWLEQIEAFPPASIAEIDGLEPAAGLLNVRTFWDPDYDVALPKQSAEDSIEELRSLVQDSIRLRLHADVPVGVALSGGLDSSIISVQATSAHGDPTKLFSAVNPGSKGDESVHIDAMEQHLGSSALRFRLNPNEGGGLIGLLTTCTRHSDGPVNSFSSLLFYKLMECARSAGISVVLTGQGADEVFCGYRKYPILEIKRLLMARRLVEAAKLASSFITNGTMLSQFSYAESKRYAGTSNNTILGKAAVKALDLEALGRITSLSERQWLDVSRYSVPYLCHYEDRMSMACSREVRSPFLDYRVVEMGLRMPERLKLSQGWTKYALRKAFERDLPSSITWRKDKQGFVNPQDVWMKGSLQPVVRELMGDSNARVYQYGLIDQSGYLKLFDRYCRGHGHVWFRDVFAPFALELWMTIAAEIEQDLKKKMQCHNTS